MDDQRWETEALREGQARRSGRPAVSQNRRPAPSQPAAWVTLREASDATGIPVGTLGSWARRGTVDSYLEGNGGRKLRIVDLNDVRGRARELGRPVAPVPIREVEASVSSPLGGRGVRDRSTAEGDQSSDLGPVASAERSEAEGAGGETDENVMIVPLDAWNKVLNQLGNLHEAGQQLAEARERAAKAETEATFLRERLAELRDQEAPSAAEPSPTASPPPSGGDQTETSIEEPPDIESAPENAPQRLWQYVYGSWKARKR